jgi:uncharacterized NAD(P)/FAD-binding protein YdhS
VNTLSQQSGSRPVIAIVGGGASGTLTALQLLRQAAAQRLDLRIDLIDRYGRHGLGQAYSTSHEAHLLNTPAGQMSALPDDPDHLIRWAGVPGEAFLPRRTYGQYLRETLANALAQAPSAQLARISSEVASIARTQTGRAIRLTLADGWLEADMAVLALGAMTAGLPFEAPASSRIVADPWQPGALDQIRDNRPVVIVGTGLTMIDLAIAISDQSPGSLIYAVSRHGLLPRSHPASPATGQAGRPSVSASRGHVRLAELMAQVRSAVAASPESWHDVVGSIRPHVPELWRGFPDSDKRLFLRHVARYWEIHRHLMPPTTAAKLAALRESGRLEVLAGRVTDVADDVTGQFLVRITPSGQRDLDGACVPAREVTAGWIINAAGSATDIRATADPLLNGLLASGTVRPDSLGLGLDATPDGALISASGAISDTFYTLGPPLRGLWYETTAIPEIRSQAAALAARITADRRLRGQRDSAA